MTLLLKKFHKIKCKSIIIGAMKTKMLSETPSTISKLPVIGKFLESKLSISVNEASKKIIENFENDRNTILIPNIPILLVKFIVKIIEIVEKNNAGFAFPSQSIYMESMTDDKPEIFNPKK